MLTWEEFERAQDLAEEPTPEITCPVHKETFPPSGFCGTCYVEELKQVAELLKNPG